MVKYRYVPVAQLDRALVCGTNGCRFDPGQVRIMLKLMCASVAQLDRASVFGTEC